MPQKKLNYWYLHTKQDIIVEHFYAVFRGSKATIVCCNLLSNCLNFPTIWSWTSSKLQSIHIKENDVLKVWTRGSTSILIMFNTKKCNQQVSRYKQTGFKFFTSVLFLYLQPVISCLTQLLGILYALMDIKWQCNKLMMPKVLITQKKCVVYYHYSYLQEYQPTSYSQCPGDGAGVLIFICQSLT